MPGLLPPIGKAGEGNLYSMTVATERPTATIIKTIAGKGFSRELKFSSA